MMFLDSFLIPKKFKIIFCVLNVCENIVVKINIYFNDIFIGIKNYKYGCGLSIIKFARFFILRFDLYFVLIADEKVIYKQKQEASSGELEKQIKRYRDLCDGRQYFSVGVDKSSDKITKKIIMIMMDKINE